jgi:hypothetical protein
MIRRIFPNLYFLTFLNGFLLASLFYFKMEANYENDLFSAIRSNISGKITASDSQDSVLAKIMHSCNQLLVNRESVFEGKQFDGFSSDNILAPASFDLMTARGACGSYSLILARVLKGYHYSVRIAQMKSGGVFAAHNIVEAKTDHGWAVLDPFFDVYFINPSNKLASFEDVKNNWSYYKTQLPPGYDMKFRYEDVRYSNWTKIPVLLPSVKKILDLTIGKKEADTISLRTYFLKKYNIVFNILLVIFFMVFSFTLVQLIKSKVFPEENIPVTFSNIFKYLRLHLNGKSFSEQEPA